MSRVRFTLCFLITIMAFTTPLLAEDANSCLEQGRAYLFEGTVSGLRDAYDTFDGCLNDTNCIDCTESRELKFLHAVTRVIMWCGRDDGLPIDSAVELAQDFGISLLGDSFLELGISYPEHPAASYGTHDMPVETPDVNEFKTYGKDELWPTLIDFVNNTTIPEINAVLAEFDSIEDSPSDPFRIFFYPHETTLEKTIEVDYGEVLLLKGALSYAKAFLQTKSAYDLFVDSNDMLLEKAYAGDLKLNDDVLGPYPYFLEILPTINDPNDGKAILAQAKSDLLTGIDYCFMALDYVLTEEDPQTDDVLYIDPRDYAVLDEVLFRLQTIRSSLLDDDSITHPLESHRRYAVLDVNSAEKGYLFLELDAFGAVRDGNFSFQIDPYTYPGWDVESFRVNDSVFLAELEMGNDPGTGGILAGTISADQSKIREMTFEYWGAYDGNFYQLSANLNSQSYELVEFDINPVFGGTPRYPNPVSPRKLLPEFDNWNYPLPGTMAWALGNDGTFGGLAPGMTQRDWQIMGDLQPGGLFYLDFISPWQVVIDGDSSDWTTEQLVFEDLSSDDDSSWPGGVDIENYYMAYDSNNIYGAITLYDVITTTDPDYNYIFTVYLSYDQGDVDCLDSIKLEINVSQGMVSGELYLRTVDTWGSSYWSPVDSFEVAAVSSTIEFKIPFTSFPSYIPGRFIGIDSELMYNGWIKIGGERNHTRLRIGEVGNISGTLSFNEPNFLGVPIIVQAYTDDSDPEGTIVASTVIEEPGAYRIEGIGLGWQGWVRGLTGCYNFNEASMDAIEVETAIPVFVWQPETTGVDIVLPACSEVWPSAAELTIGVPYNSSITNEDADELWHHFVADINGVYSVVFTGDFDAFLSVHDDVEGQKLVSTYDYELEINLQEGKHCYVLVDRYWGEGNYTLTVSHFAPPVLNDECSDAAEAMVGVIYNGSTVGCIGDDITKCGIGDDYDVWYTFTPSSDGVYQFELIDSIDATLAVFDDCSGEQLLCKNPWEYSGPAYLNASEGEPLFIRIAGSWGQIGDYSLTISYFSPPLANDECEDAIELFIGTTESGSNYGALNDDVWYMFTATQSGIYDVNLININPYIDVFDDCDGNEVPTGYSVKSYFAAETGKTYYVRLERDPWSEPGNFTIDLSYVTAAVINDNREGALVVEPNNAYPGSTIWATQDGRSSCGWGDELDVWYSFIPQNSGIYSVKLTGVDFTVGLSIFEEGWPLWLSDTSQVLCKNAYADESSYFYAKAGFEY
jgi:hypothetical protein